MYRVLVPRLEQLGDGLLPQLRAVLQGDDPIWKLNLLHLAQGAGLVKQLQAELLQLSTHATTDEVTEGVQELAQTLLREQDAWQAQQASDDARENARLAALAAAQAALSSASNWLQRAAAFTLEFDTLTPHTEAELDAAERELGMALPGDYRAVSGS